MNANLFPVFFNEINILLVILCMAEIIGYTRGTHGGLFYYIVGLQSVKIMMVLTTRRRDAKIIFFYLYYLQGFLAVI